MRLLRCICSIALILQFSQSGSTQQTDVSSPQRDPQAEALVRRAIAALGGEPAWSLVADAVTTGNVQLVVNGQPQSSAFVWKISGSEFRYELQTPTRTTVFQSGYGHPAQTQGSKTMPLSAYMALASPPYHLPALVLLRRLNNPQCSLALIGTETLAGRSVVRIRTSLTTDNISTLVTVQDWLLEPALGLPLRVEYRLPDNANAASRSSAAIEFSDFRLAGGLVVPFHLVNYTEGASPAVATVASVVFNMGVSPSDFGPPTGSAQ